MDKYKIIQSATILTLELQVNAMMEEGYKTVGGPFTTGLFQKGFCQAMILKEVNPVKVGPTEIKSRTKN